jgi:DNA polymerase I-like protein with 3'-5' exonuclease and polymerase domains
MKVLTFDLEANGFYDEVTKIWCICMKNYTTGETLRFGPHELDLGLDELFSADVIVGHNIIDYDCPVITKLTGRNDFPRIVDTLVLSRLIYPDIQDREVNVEDMPTDLTVSHSLKAYGYRLGILKGDFGEIEGFEFYKPEMLDYCEQDVEITDALLRLLASHNFSREAQTIEHDFAHLMSLQMRSGFQFDLLKAYELKQELEVRLNTLREELLSTVPDKVVIGKSPSMYHYPIGDEGQLISHASKGKLRKIVKLEFPNVTLADINNTIIHGQPKITYVPFNPGSTQQRVKMLGEMFGWVPYSFTEKGNAQCTEEMIRRIEEPLAQKLADYMKVSKIHSMVAGSGKKDSVPWLDMVGDDGRIHGFVNPCGAATGRCKHSKPNMAQIPSVQLDDDENVLWGFEGGYGADCRSLFIVPEDKDLVGADLSGIEARLLAHFLYQYDGGDYVDLILNGDVHTFNQESAGLPTRSIAKKLLYMTLYGAGPAKIAIDVGVTIEEATEMKDALLNGVPAIQQLINRLLAEKRVNRGWIKGLDGRKLWIRHDHAILNTLLQNAGAVIIKKATVLAFDKMIDRGYTYDVDFKMCSHTHDELQWEVEPCMSKEVGELMAFSMEEAGKYFNLNIPTSGEYKIGRNWQETH